MILDHRPGVTVPRPDGRIARILGDGVTVTEDPATGVLTVRADDLPCPILIDEEEAVRAANGLTNLIAARLLEARRELADAAAADPIGDYTDHLIRGEN